MGWRAGNGKAGHWSGLEADDADRCRWGNIRRYCCDPTAWDNAQDDFGADFHGEGGWLGWFGEPLDGRLCEAAVAHGFDPHDVWDHDEMNYKPHKHWFAQHVHDVVNLMREERAMARITGAAGNRAEPVHG